MGAFGFVRNFHIRVSFDAVSWFSNQRELSGKNTILIYQIESFILVVD